MLFLGIVGYLFWVAYITSRNRNSYIVKERRLMNHVPYIPTLITLFIGSTLNSLGGGSSLDFITLFMPIVAVLNLFVPFYVMKWINGSQISDTKFYGIVLVFTFSLSILSYVSVFVIPWFIGYFIRYVMIGAEHILQI